MNSPAFDFVASDLEKHSGLNRLQARGVLRLSIKNGGLDPSRVTCEQLGVVIEKLLSEALQKNGITAAKASQICQALHDALKSATLVDVAVGSSPEAMFDRLDDG